MAANFRFNFEISDADQDCLLKQQKLGNKEKNLVADQTAELINPREELLNVLQNKSLVKRCIELPGVGGKNSASVWHLSVNYVESLIRYSHEYSSSGTLQALKRNTDLIPSRYEGGMKIWECSLDLVEFLHQTVSQGELRIAGKKVLELGCGAGLPGIFSLINGATVHFQDYNAEVLKLFTIPNVALNVSSKKVSGVISSQKDVLESMQNSCQFISGDWSTTRSLLKPASYDIILTSETIYNINMQHWLYELIKYCLKPGGVVFIAAKTYYFGVGGGTEQFANIVLKDGMFDIRTVCTHSNGVRREILRMQIVS